MSEEKQGMFTCPAICWIVGALVGLVAALIIKGTWGVIVGLALAVALALVLKRLFCGAAGELGMPHHHIGADAAITTGAGASAALDHDDDARARAAADAAASAKTGDEEAAAGIAGEGGRYTPAAVLDAAAVAADKPARSHAKPAPTPAPAAAPQEASVAEDAGEGTRPAALKAARGGKPDDLKLIKGVGPKLEQLCNELGFYHWDQIAHWTAAEVAWVDANLKGFKGRVSRDSWVDQARVLAAGGTTEFAERAEKTGLYDKK